MKYTLGGLIHAYRRFGRFNNGEWISAIITSVAFGFMFSFRMWGDNSVGGYSALAGIYNWTMYSIFALLGILALQFGTRFMAVEMGYEPSYQRWTLGLVVGVVLCFITNGFFVFLTPGGYDLKSNKGLALGKYRKTVVFYERGYLVFWGFFSLVAYCSIIKVLFPSTFGDEMVKVALFSGLYSLLPLDIIAKIWMTNVPISNGSSLFFGNYYFGFFTLFFIGISSFLLIFVRSIWLLLIAVVISILAYWVFYIFLAGKNRRLYDNKK